MSRSWFRVFVALVLVLPAMLSAQQRDPRAPVKSGGTASVRGVVNDRRQTPLPNAIVRLTCEAQLAQWMTLSDGNGRFAFESLPADRCEVSASKAGFVTDWFGTSPSAAPAGRLQLNDGVRIDDVTFSLARAAAISGVVTLDGDPINARVAISPFAAPGRPPTTVTGGNATTDHRGRFRIGNLAPGELVTIQGLAEAFDVSAMPVREALTRLTSERALMVVAGRSVGIPNLDPLRLKDLTRVRLSIETTAVRWAADVIAREQLAELETLCKAMDKAIRKGDRRGFVRASCSR